jgi:hypothetical protein
VQLAYEKSWSSKRAMSTQQWGALQAALAHLGDPHTISAEACWDLAEALGIDYENVSTQLSVLRLGRGPATRWGGLGAGVR